MLKTNSRQARENVKKYIMECWNLYEEDQAKSWEETKAEIIADFERCAYRSEYERKQNKQSAFAGWLSGLPRGLGDYFLYRAVDDLGDILEETEEERKRYGQDEAEKKMSYLIYAEVTR